MADIKNNHPFHLRAQAFTPSQPLIIPTQWYGNRLPISTTATPTHISLPSTQRSHIPIRAIILEKPSEQVKPSTTPTKTTEIPASTSPLFIDRNFSSLGLTPTIVDALATSSITFPTGIQARGIPPILSSTDVILGAATGSGKTLAYLLPVIQQLKHAEDLREPHHPPLRINKRPRAIILVPTRELAEQVVHVARQLSHQVKFRVIGAIGGGRSGDRILQDKLESGPVDILVATTGRLLQLLQARSIDVRFCKHVIIDEVDTMFDAGFGPELRSILLSTTKNGNKPQFVAAGATHPRAAETVYNEVLPGAVRVDVDLHRAPKGLEQRFLETASQEKVHELLPLLRDAGRDDVRVMVFCNTMDSCRFVGHVVEEAGLAVASIHGDVPPGRRDMEYEKFKSGKVGILVCTDMAARGLDNVHVQHVILFDFPNSAVDYLHRSGRTARAGMTGRVTSFVTRKDMKLARAIQNAGRKRMDALEAVRQVREHDEDERRIQKEMKVETKGKAVGEKKESGGERNRINSGRGKMVNKSRKARRNKYKVKGW